MKKYEILFLSSYAPMDLADLLSGIVSLRESHGCNVHIIGDIASRKTLKRLLEFWSPDGCIIHCGLRDDCFVPADFGRIPTVWLDRDPASLPPGSLCVMQDARSVGRIAAKELLKYDLESYAFVDRPDPQFWSKGRRDAFKEAVDLNGRAYFEFGEKRRHWWSQKLPGFLSSLPRPAGVFCTNDIVAADVISAATRLGIAIPDDMAVVGVDDADIGDMVTSKDNPVELAPIKVEEPTMSVVFEASTSPLVGREGDIVGSRQLHERLMREKESNISMRIEECEDGTGIEVAGRGVLHLSVLMETISARGTQMSLAHWFPKS